MIPHIYDPFYIRDNGLAGGVPDNVVGQFRGEAVNSGEVFDGCAKDVFRRLKLMDEAFVKMVSDAGNPF